MEARFENCSFALASVAFALTQSSPTENYIYKVEYILRMTILVAVDRFKGPRYFIKAFFYFDSVKYHLAFVGTENKYSIKPDIGFFSFWPEILKENKFEGPNEFVEYENFDWCVSSFK